MTSRQPEPSRQQRLHDLCRRQGHGPRSQRGSRNRRDGLRRLVELGVASTTKTPARRSVKNAAAQTIDRLVDKAAPAEEQASRKRRLLKGPEEFRDVRASRTKKK